MRKLSHEKRIQIINALVEGCSINSTARMCSVSKLTILRLLADVGSLCRDYHDIAVRGLRSELIQCDELWSFVGCKQKNRELGKAGNGDVWTWVGMDADSKIVIAYLVSDRGGVAAREFISDIADRLTGRVQLTTDAHGAYLGAIEDVFGLDIDYAQLHKTFGPDDSGRGAERKYSPGKCNGTRKVPYFGLPDREHISTSYVERQNLTLRMGQRRFTRLTNAFSKKLANHAHAVALHYFHYNFIRRHKTLKTTPAVAAGIADREWKLDDLVRLLEDEEHKVANGGRINRADRS
ncbi:MAG: IS1 family transposase [Planctomycetes bacterium]|nr:IS1 family transposase [Planctomycetota bacterium]